MDRNETTAQASALMPDTDLSEADNYTQRAELMPSSALKSVDNSTQRAELMPSSALKSVDNSTQRAELMPSSATAAQLALHRQLEEAVNASLALQPYPSSASAIASSSNPLPLFPEPEEDDEGDFISFANLEDRKHVNFIRALSRARGERLAFQISEIPEDKRRDYVDVVARPIDAARTVQEPSFQLYFKGMAIRDTVEGSSLKLAAIAVAICDPKGDLMHEIQKPVPYSAVRTCREVLEITALIEGLNAAISLGIKWLTVFCDYKTLINHVMGISITRRNKVANLINQVQLLQMEFENCVMLLLPRSDIRFVFGLARGAIDSQLSKNLVDHRITGETCKICLEIIDSSQMFAANNCSHTFCFSCMKQHIEVKLLTGMLPGCPHDGCKIMFDLEVARKFLAPDLLELMIYRLKEASVPVAEKVYCPYPNCSALMSVNEAILPQQESSLKEFIFDASGLRKCIKCKESFCITCKVPWHEGLSCSEFESSDLCPTAEEKLLTLAKEKSWRQCTNCSHMIELVVGCLHMTCRCGHEFCYACGAEYKGKSATCQCSLFDYNDADEEEDGYFDHDTDYHSDGDF